MYSKKLFHFNKYKKPYNSISYSTIECVFSILTIYYLVGFFKAWVSKTGFAPLQENFFKVRPRFFCRTALTQIAIARCSPSLAPAEPRFLSRVLKPLLTAPIHRHNFPAIVLPYLAAAFFVKGIIPYNVSLEFLSALYQKEGWISND